MPRTHTTTQGETWDLIAYDWYGDAAKRPELHMHHLLAANPDYRETVVFDGGITLTIPEDPEPSASESLPPWKV